MNKMNKDVQTQIGRNSHVPFFSITLYEFNVLFEIFSPKLQFRVKKQRVKVN